MTVKITKHPKDMVFNQLQMLSKIKKYGAQNSDYK